MENLSKQDLIQIIDFYKNKASQQELQYLLLQVDTNNKIKALKDKIDSDTADYAKHVEDLQNHSIVLLENEKAKKQKEIDAIIKKYEKKVNQKK